MSEELQEMAAEASVKQEQALDTQAATAIVLVASDAAVVAEVVAA